MKKLTLFIVAICLLGGLAYAASELANQDKYYTWRYKMMVEIETPEGLKTGSTVREMGNAPKNADWPDVGNPADVRGEAVVVDLGNNRVLFALISDQSDNRFYDTFPIPGQEDGQGGSTEEGMKYHASLPIGTKGVMNPAEPPGYPTMVTFKDLNDPKTVTKVQIWERDKNGRFYLKEDRMEDLFGEGVKLKQITLEITNEPVTWGVVDQYLPSVLLNNFQEWWQSISSQEKMRLANLLQFKQGSPK